MRVNSALMRKGGKVIQKGAISFDPLNGEGN